MDEIRKLVREYSISLATVTTVIDKWCVRMVKNPDVMSFDELRAKLNERGYECQMFSNNVTYWEK